MKIDHKIDFGKYIGIPYKHLGRDWNGVDCWGLAVLIFKEEFNIELPDFTELKYDLDWYKKGSNHFLDNKGSIDGTFWEIIEPPYQLIDCFLFYLTSKKIANHGAIYIGSNKMIHTYENSDVHISRFDDRFWSSKFYKAFRYKG